MLYTCYIHASCVVESIYMYFDGPFVLHIYSSTHLGATKPETTPETRHAYVVENKMKKKKGAARGHKAQLCSHRFASCAIFSGQLCMYLHGLHMSRKG